MAGAGYKLFNTGDVLTAAQVNTYLMEQTVMVFNDAASRTTALTGVVAEGMLSYLKSTKQVEVYNGSAWVASDDPNAIQNTIVDAKGDLITATAADTPARLAVGNNGDSLVADNSTSTGLRWQADWNTGKNKVINGDFNIWQRGTSFTANGAFNADRFYQLWDGSGATKTITQQTFTPGTAPVSGYESQYFLRFNQSVAGSGGTYNMLGQKIEDVRTFAGQTATFSFWAKASTTVTLPFAPNLIQNFGSGGSAETYPGFTDGPRTLTTSWQRFSFVTNVPSIAGKTIGSGSHLKLEIPMPLNTTFTIDTWGWQFEGGSVATPFTTATGTLAGELAACQRYYYRQTPSTSYGWVGYGLANGTTGGAIGTTFPVQMRTTPSAVEYSTLSVSDASGAIAVTSLTLDTSVSSAYVGVCNFGVASGLTAYRPYYLRQNASASGYLAYTAEL